jgi:hypothetical protein
VHVSFPRYLSLERGGPFLRWVLSIAGFRDRVLMDPSFLTKLGIEMSIGGAIHAHIDLPFVRQYRLGLLCSCLMS